MSPPARWRAGLLFICLVLGVVLIFPLSPSAQRTGGGVAAHLEFGHPGGDGQVLDKGYFVISYDTEARVAEWVAYRLRRGDLTGAVDRTDDFRVDDDLEEDAQSDLKDYRSSGYVRGHLAPAEDFSRSERAMSTTFFYSNMAPQRPKLNGGRWKALENQVRKLADAAGTIYVVTGSLFGDRKPASHRRVVGRVTVPRTSTR